MGRICDAPFFFGSLSLGKPSVSAGGGAALIFDVSVACPSAGASAGRDAGTNATCCDSGAVTRCAWVKPPSAGTGCSIVADVQPGPVQTGCPAGMGTRRGGFRVVGRGEKAAPGLRVGWWGGGGGEGGGVLLG